MKLNLPTHFAIAVAICNKTNAFCNKQLDAFCNKIVVASCNNIYCILKENVHEPNMKLQPLLTQKI